MKERIERLLKKFESKLKRLFKNPAKVKREREKLFRELTSVFENAVKVGLEQMREKEREELAKGIDELGRGFTRLGKRFEKRVISEIKKGIKKDKTFSEIRKKIEPVIRGARGSAWTLTATGVGAVNEANRVNSAVKHGYEYFKYTGPTPERPFCKEHWGKIYHIDEIKQMDNGQGLPVLYYRGGYNCTHTWMPVSEEAKSVADANGLPNKRGGGGKEENFTVNQREVRSLIKKKFNIEMPVQFYKDDFEESVKIHKVNGKKTYYLPNKKIIRISNKKQTGYSKKKAIAHEAGHHRHYIQGLVSDDNIAGFIKSEFDKHLSLVKDKERIKDILKVETSLRVINGKTKRVIKKSKYFLEFTRRHPEIDISDAFEMYSATEDYFQALTKNEIDGYGYRGHKPSYFEQGNNAYMEWFAHCSENYYVGNKFFKEYFPEFYKETINFMKRIRK